MLEYAHRGQADSQIRLRLQRGHLVLDLPGASEATVPQHPLPLRKFPG
jgi:hypothetical protein